MPLPTLSEDNYSHNREKEEPHHRRCLTHSFSCSALRNRAKQIIGLTCRVGRHMAGESTSFRRYSSSMSVEQDVCSENEDSEYERTCCCAGGAELLTDILAGMAEGSASMLLLGPPGVGESSTLKEQLKDIQISKGQVSNCSAPLALVLNPVYRLCRQDNFAQRHCERPCRQVVWPSVLIFSAAILVH